MVKAGDIRRPLRGLLNKARSPEEMKMSYGRLGQWLGGDCKLADNLGKQHCQGERATIDHVALRFVHLQEICRRIAAMTR